ncbi:MULTISPECIES: hypothetical protein [Brucella]|uniref:Uncharacterized protein n=2 Tax=Brucella lupini TaxID=255457 RepID=A0A256GW27_9HYPH|nr:MULTISPECIES: hypothetical protein [Brucella]MCR8490544.1 hypothetical protein [Brucella anthropi]OYR31373.1 hypothetical protein CES86_0865 [Brucella lupini]
MTNNRGDTPEAHMVPDFRKDYKLDRLAERFNVAQFVSFAPAFGEPLLQYSRLVHFPPNSSFDSLEDALRALFERSAQGTVNIRSFSEEQSQSREFIYALRTVDDAAQAIRRLSSEGAFTIANETVDVSDGGVSGVAMGGLVEFRPDSTPRGVERPGFASLPTEWATKLFETVYGFDPGLEESEKARIEFSLHPEPRGWRQTNVIFWECGKIDHFDRTACVSWPNDFSRLIGDKVFGLLIAELAGLPVPRTTVIARRVAPFCFGAETGVSQQWIRTSPTVQVPGRYTTAKRWQDPFRLVQVEDPEGTVLASIVAQQSVRAAFSGAAIESSDGELIIEGAKGTGEGFMLGTVQPQSLPLSVVEAVTAAHSLLKQKLGSVRFEWVFDGVRAWIVQLHVGASQTSGLVLVPGDREEWVVFNVANGLEDLRQLVASLPMNKGIQLNGHVGRTSHIADVVRKANVPTRLMDDVERKET